MIEAALATASGKDLEFLHAMALDEGPSTVGDIVRRTGSRPTLVAKYRTRLLAAGLVESPGHGKVAFAYFVSRYLSPTKGVDAANIPPRGGKLLVATEAE